MQDRVWNIAEAQQRQLLSDVVHRKHSEYEEKRLRHDSAVGKQNRSVRCFGWILSGVFCSGCFVSQTPSLN